MQLDRRLLAGLVCTGLLVVSQAKAQPAPAAAPMAPVDSSAPPAPAAPESLETPYSDTPPTTPPTAPQSPGPAPAVASPRAQPPPPTAPQPDKRPLGPIRSRRKLALTGELGWNGLAGFGPVLTYYPDPHVGLDLGGGISLLGWKGGVRGRYLFSTAPFTPFVGVGFDATTGLGEVTTDPSDPKHPDPVTLNFKPSYLIQYVAGFDFIHKHGFNMVGCLGYAQLLNKHNYEVLAGSLTSDETQGFKVVFRSGPVISFAAGYAWE
jgi:hypothetical protein